jgi:hypothetical protein
MGIPLGPPELVALFLERGADPVEADTEPWATPRAWAEKMKHAVVMTDVIEVGLGVLRIDGATAASRYRDWRRGARGRPFVREHPLVLEEGDIGSFGA